MKTKPVIGINGDYRSARKEGVALSWFNTGYYDSITAAGGLPQEHPPYDLWCTADGDYVFLRGAVGGYMQTRYELVELTR